MEQSKPRQHESACANRHASDHAEGSQAGNTGYDPDAKAGAAALVIQFSGGVPGDEIGQIRHG